MSKTYNQGGKDGVIVRFLTKNSWFIGAVTATGKIDSPPRSGQLENASGLDLGQPFNEAKVQQAAAAQKRLMESNGLFLSKITPSFTYDQSYQQINIRFDVNSGPRARFTTPVLLGRRETRSPHYPESHEIPPLDHPYLEAHDADARQRGSG